MMNLVRPFETFTNVGGTMQNPNPNLGGRHGPYVEGSGNMSTCQLILAHVGDRMHIPPSVETKVHLNHCHHHQTKLMIFYSTCHKLPIL